MQPPVTPSVVSRSIALTVALGLGAWAPVATAAEPATPEPGPVAPVQVAPTPAEPAPAEPTPVAPAPAEPAPVAPAPAEATPVTQPAPAEPTPVTQPAPVEPGVVAPVYGPPEAAAAAPQSEERDKAGRRAKAMLIAGWSTFGTAYTGSVMVGAIYNDVTDAQSYYGYWMFAPLIGPIGAALESESSFGALFGAGMAVAQIGGLAVGILGTVRYRQWKRGVVLSALPTRGGGQLGLGMRF